MTNVAWFHCFCGIAGDMALASLVDAGADLDEVRELCERIPVGGWKLEAESVLRGGVGATHVIVHTEETGVVRTAGHINGLIEEARLPDRVRRRALATFAALASAEGRLHRRPPEQVHFHEVGGIDAIIDVVGTCAALELLAIDEIHSSPVANGIGMVRAAHGLLPNPPPAVIELLRGAPTFGIDIAAELTTPTGAALLAANVTRWGPLPAMTIAATGFGAGTRELDARPNLAQVVIGVLTEGLATGQPVTMLEVNVDDATGETLAHTLAMLMEAGAHDAWITPIVMKKGRPAHTVSVLCDPSLAAQVAATLTSETGSLGVRGQTFERWPAPRREDEVEVDGAIIRVKVGPGRVKVEHDDAARAARKLHLPLREVVSRAEEAWRQTSPAHLDRGAPAGRRRRRMTYDAVVVGAGPNGLAAAVTIARAGRSVLVIEAADHVGGGAASAELTIPGVIHDVCAAVHPLAATSPFFRSLPLREHGLEWVHPEIDLAHPLDDGTAAVLSRSLDFTAASLQADGDAWRSLVGPIITRWRDVADGVLAPLIAPRHPLAMMHFALAGALPTTLIGKRFSAGRGDALLAGLAAHSCIPLAHPFTAGLALVLGVAGHVDGWPVARGGTQAIAEALVSYLRELGGDVKTGQKVTSLAQLPEARVLLFDLGPRAAVELLGDRAARRVATSARRFRYGTGVCKIDYALSEPVPWSALDARRAGTLHLGGSMAEIADAEREVARGRRAPRPFVLVSQPTVCDPSRALEGTHTLWAYSHVPADSDLDATPEIEAQIERFAPGFRDVVIARSVRTTSTLEASNPNLVGGDIAGGALDRLQLLARPRVTLQPYRLGAGAYLCSASTPPGAGVHGMCGHHAANAALRHELR